MTEREQIIEGLLDVVADLSPFAGDHEGWMKVHRAIKYLKETQKPDCEHAEYDGVGCLGYCGCTQDDEPIEACKRCEKYTGNISEGG